jgi:hypothetical protein
MNDSNKATGVIIVELDASDCTGIAMTDSDGRIWVTFSRPWWDIASWLWFWLMPGETKWVMLKKRSGTFVRIRAKQIASQLVRVGRKG